ncbi:MAG TPA: tRNA (adenosine(37)-N6)-threonylcarbamoyltransferase complex dimerization subunit type 1 TsaB [Chloroflexota bacterium]|jgi:tRNA threonylcarbamoyladenosine biosynthesis protein TsaB|nr:tRNA (adenosine(37)-N6)-threonylcarbamoyltransferase complex dimerization subunit type 1 TsaB [Chloroflexota bacterium]
MNLLSLDAVTRFASVAVTRDDEIVYARTWHAGSAHSTQLPGAAADALSAAGLEPSQLNGVVVGIGPGSYTGIRVGLSLAKGLALATTCRVVGVSSLETLAYACALWDATVCAVAELGTGHVGMATFEGGWRRWRRLDADRAFVVEDAPGVIPSGALVCGWGADRLQLLPDIARAPEAYDHPSAAVQAQLGLRLLREDRHETFSIEPNYLRRSSPEERAALQEANF